MEQKLEGVQKNAADGIGKILGRLRTRTRLWKGVKVAIDTWNVRAMVEALDHEMIYGTVPTLKAAPLVEHNRQERDPDESDCV